MLENGKIRKWAPKCKDFKTSPSACRRGKHNILKTAHALKLNAVVFTGCSTHVFFHCAEKSVATHARVLALAVRVFETLPSAR